MKKLLASLSLRQRITIAVVAAAVVQKLKESGVEYRLPDGGSSVLVASVLVRLKLGAHLAARNLQAINHLVASAVEGLSPDAVSALDMKGNLIWAAPRRLGAWI